MTSQEEQMLNSLVERVNATKLTEKDADAEGLLQRGFSSNPDAVYVLSQSVLVQNIALEQARAQLTESQQRVVELQQKVEQLQQQAQQPAHATSFLGSLLGHKDPPPQQPAYQPVYTPQAPQYQTPYNPAPAKATVSEIYVDSNQVAKIQWSKAATISSNSATQATLTASSRTAGDVVTGIVPAKLLVKQTYLIFSEVSYLYVPTIGYVMAKSGVNLSDVAYARSRQAVCVIYNGVPTDPCPTP